MSLLETLRSFKILDIAAFDLIITYVSVFCACKYLNVPIPVIKFILSTVLIQSIVIHQIVGKETALIRKLNEKHFNVHKAIVLLTLLLSYYFYRKSEK